MLFTKSASSVFLISTIKVSLCITLTTSHLSFSSLLFFSFLLILFTCPSSPLFLLGDKYHEAYQSANETFFDSVIPHIKEGDVVWVHDYHLMKLPKLLRDANLKISIVFYLHIPFPTSQVREGKRRKMIRSEISRIDEESKMLGEEEKGKEEEK